MYLNHSDFGSMFLYYALCILQYTNMFAITTFIEKSVSHIEKRFNKCVFIIPLQ